MKVVELAGWLFALVAAFYAGHERGASREASKRLDIHTRLLEQMERERCRTAQLVESLGRACGWKFEPATKEHLARWVSCGDADANGVVVAPPAFVTETASAGPCASAFSATPFVSGFSVRYATEPPAASGDAPKRKRARTSSTGATRRKGRGK